MLANSEPTAPAPITMTLAGIVSERRTSSLVTIRLPSRTRPGRLFTREPVASTTSVPLSTRSPPAPGVPSSPASCTRTLVPPSSRPRPAIQVTSFFLTRLPTPFHIRVTIWSRRLAICAKSTSAAAGSRRPKSPAWRMRSATAADSSIALVGMQPRCRHVPPILSSSTRATRRPSWAPRNAAAYPPVPAPRTMRSKSFEDPTAIGQVLRWCHGRESGPWAAVPREGFWHRTRCYTGRRAGASTSQDSIKNRAAEAATRL